MPVELVSNNYTEGRKGRVGARDGEPGGGA